MSRTEELLEMFDRQLHTWPDAAARYEALQDVKQRELADQSMDADELTIRLQFNPARVVSTSAKVDKASIKARPCFLCATNRPTEQIIYNGFTGYDTLVNPFPIFSKHFTIASKTHTHQDKVDFTEMAAIAKELPGMVVFYNGSKAGASAPDHLHFQAGNKNFLPLCSLLEEEHGVLMRATTAYKAYDPVTLPINAVHFVSDNITPEMLRWFDTLLPTDDESMTPDLGMRNMLMWVDDANCLHTLFIPRAKHRPDCYYAEDGMLISPGAVDMAGVIILPREKDFDKVSKTDIRHIYDEVSFCYKDTEAFKKLMLI
ncbi:MAG: DUF4922 domain-containing protein [Muribaculaceae bacterium]|nr:DUF4922 domain-containing protein [Muribaculaceae bacterium]